MIATPQKYLNFLSYLTTVFDGVEDLIALLEYRDSEYVLVLANEPFARQAGQMVERLQGKLMREVLSPEQFVIAGEHYDKVRLERSEQQFEYAWPDGRQVAVTCYPVENALGEPVYLVSIARDVSELRREQARREELEAQVELLAATVSARETVLVVNAAGVVELATGDWFGGSSAALVGRGFDELVRLLDGATFAHLSPTLPANGRMVSVEAQALQPDGEAVAVTCELRRQRGKGVAEPRVAVVVRTAPID
ncbi:MAG TPA: PAS domain-containing protein [Candidatus Saccharimonadia bacterium]|jgi:PAS domain S-box-containing protein|nr:PAS domain-containing protein [Candidatus Saccharimonadia bacterium]